MTLKNKVEAVLFAVGKKIEVEEIAKICNRPIEKIKEVLSELQTEYNSRDSAVMLTGSETLWKLNIREKYLPLVKDLTVDTDLNRPTMETLAVVAYNSPVLQSDIVKQRGVGAYEHIKELLDNGFITRERKGRSYNVKITKRFFEYFDLNKKDMRKLFGSFKKDEEIVQEFEKEIEVLEAQKKEEEGILKKEREEVAEKAEQTFGEKMKTVAGDVDDIKHVRSVEDYNEEQKKIEEEEEKKEQERLAAIEKEKEEKKKAIVQKRIVRAYKLKDKLVKQDLGEEEILEALKEKKLEEYVDKPLPSEEEMEKLGIKPPKPKEEKQESEETIEKELDEEISRVREDEKELEAEMEAAEAEKEVEEELEKPKKKRGRRSRK